MAEPNDIKLIVLDVDGVRVVFEDGWGLVRCSNTSPMLIVRSEGRTPELRDEILQLLLYTLEGHEGVDLTPLRKALGSS